jgi:DNA-binding protein H-NS|tara:strand:+ start:367 stop:564 length:198 start_codon:yes stop_codon:yes gene_type:complete
MRNRNLLDRKLSILEGTLTVLENIVNTQQPIESYKINIVKAQGVVEEIRDMIEAEPMSPSEMNKT